MTEAEFAMKVDFRRPLEPPPEKAESAWCIPFEYGENAKGTLISILKAKQIAAELRAEIAEAEKRGLFRAFKAEEQRVEEYQRQQGKMRDEMDSLLREVFDLKVKLRKRPRSKAAK